MRDGQVGPRWPSAAGLCLSWVGIAAACGGSPAAPTVPALPVNESASVSGVVLRTQDETPIAGATVYLGNQVASTDATGGFSVSGLSDLGGAGTRFTIAADGYITRRTSCGLSGVRSGITVDLIPDGPPFLIGFFREIARNGYESSLDLHPLRPFTTPPSFYVKTRVESSGEEVPPDLIERIRTIFDNSVRELSGGHLSMVAFETGEDDRPAEFGWVNVVFQDDVVGAAGMATVGGHQGTIWIEYDPSGPGAFVNNPSGCPSQIEKVAAHEIQHTMGYWHWGDQYDPYMVDPGCDGADRSDVLRYHAAVMYSRPLGNRDPDEDPRGYMFAEAEAPTSPVVSCTFGR